MNIRLLQHLLRGQHAREPEEHSQGHARKTNAHWNHQVDPASVEKGFLTKVKNARQSRYAPEPTQM